MYKKLVRSILFMLTLASGIGLAFAARANNIDPSRILPIVFVHGAAGSGAQYGSVAKRLVVNGYPADRIRTYEYDSSNPDAIAAAPAGVDALVDQLRAEYDVERVYLVGHSLGTTVSTDYLSMPARAAKIAGYVGVDGRSIPDCRALDPGLECLGIFRGSTGMVGNEHNVYFDGTQSHVEAATSPESFAAQFEFFTGQEPDTTLILAEPEGQVEIAGRAINFPENTGVDGATLVFWEVDPETGHREKGEPVAALQLGPSGEWGPVPINGQQLYEFELQRPDTSLVLHVYYQPFIRSDYWVRLLSVPPCSPTLLHTVTGPHHAAAVVIRYREFWTTHPGGPTDILDISTRSPSMGDEPPVNALTNVLSDGIDVPTSLIGLHVHNNPPTGMTSLALIPYFGTVPFQNGVDVYMPATDPPDGTITFSSAPRGDTSRLLVLNTPNWASDKHRISVNLNDYVQDIDTVTSGSEGERKACGVSRITYWPPRHVKTQGARRVARRPGNRRR